MPSPTSATPFPVDPTPDGVTDHYGIRYPLDGDVVAAGQLQGLAVTVDAALVQAVTAAGAAAAAAYPASAQAVVAQLSVAGATSLVWAIGDGAHTTFTIAHGLGTRRFVLDVYAVTGSFDDVTPDVTRPDVNTVVLNFGAYVPAAGEFELVIVPRGLVATTTGQALTGDASAAQAQTIAAAAVAVATSVTADTTFLLMGS